MTLVDVIARLWFGLGLFIVFAGFLLLIGGFAWFVFRHFHPGEEKATPAAPDTDAFYYRQRPRRTIQLLLHQIERLNKELEAARQENARLKGYHR